MQTLILTLLTSALIAFPFAATGMLAPEAQVVHQVKMIGSTQGTARFEPAELKVRPGDRIRFVVVSGGPHNVAFDPAAVPDAAEARLAAGMPGPISPLAGPLLTAPGESYTVSTAGLPAGVYPFFCMPHVTMGMKGKITVR